MHCKLCLAGGSTTHAQRTYSRLLDAGSYALKVVRSRCSVSVFRSLCLGKLAGFAVPRLLGDVWRDSITQSSDPQRYRSFGVRRLEYSMADLAQCTRRPPRDIKLRCCGFYSTFFFISVFFFSYDLRHAFFLFCFFGSSCSRSHRRKRSFATKAHEDQPHCSQILRKQSQSTSVEALDSASQGVFQRL